MADVTQATVTIGTESMTDEQVVNLYKHLAAEVFRRNLATRVPAVAIRHVAQLTMPGYEGGLRDLVNGLSEVSLIALHKELCRAAGTQRVMLMNPTWPWHTVGPFGPMSVVPVVDWRGLTANERLLIESNQIHPAVVEIRKRLSCDFDSARDAAATYQKHFVDLIGQAAWQALLNARTEIERAFRSTNPKAFP